MASLCFLRTAQLLSRARSKRRPPSLPQHPVTTPRYVSTLHVRQSAWPTEQMLLGFAIATAVSSLCLLSKPDREPAIQMPDERPSQGDATPGIPVPPKEELRPSAMGPPQRMFVVDSEGVSSTPVITRKDQVVFAVEVEGETQHLSGALSRFMRDDLPPGQPNTVAFVLQLPATKTHSPEMTFNLFWEFLKWREQQGDFDGVGSVAGISLWGAEVGVWEYRAGTLKKMEAQKPSVPKHSASLSTEVGATE